MYHSKPIPINYNNNKVVIPLRRTESSSSDSNAMQLLAQSLGDYSSRRGTATTTKGGGSERRTGSLLQRHLAEQISSSCSSSSIAYSGYLLKRSNHPYYGQEPSLTPPLFQEGEAEVVPGPAATVARSLFIQSSANNNEIQQAASCFRQQQDDNNQEEGTSSAAAEPASTKSPHLPQHYFDAATAADERRPNSSPAVVAHPPDNKNSGSIPSSDVDDSRNNDKVPYVQEKQQQEEDDRGVGMEFMASIFGIELPSASTTNTEPQQKPKPLHPIPPRSTPVKINSSNSYLASSPVDNNKQQQSCDESPLPDNDNNDDDDDNKKPADYVDPVDGHIWRAKYCVLDNDILFFYKDRARAESSEAITERQQFLQSMQQQQPEQQQFAVATTANSNTTDVGGGQQQQRRHNNHQDLSLSPMPCRYDIDDYNNNYGDSSIVDMDTDAIWEKRVALECVGSVRSAEGEHGPHSFELSAENNDKLVLQAHNGEEMNEWLFQFHCCVANFLMDVVDQVQFPADPLFLDAPFTRAKIGDIHHPTFDNDSPPRSGRSLVSTFSPRYQKILTSSSFGAGQRFAAAQLSHGHGRNSMHRRKHDSQRGEQLSPNMPFPMLPLEQQKPPPLQSRLVTPLPPRSPEQTTMSSQERRSSVENEPELCAPQSDYPETERPMPSTGKYVPPHLRNKDGGSGAGGAYVPPYKRRQQQQQQSGGSGKYVPPRLRGSDASSNSPPPPAAADRYVPRTIRQQQQQQQQMAMETASAPQRYSSLNPPDVSLAMSTVSSSGDLSDRDGDFRHLKLGGCADPAFVSGSILDDTFVSRSASKLHKVRTPLFGYASDDHDGYPGRRQLRWEVGAFSECGIRDSNEDSFLVTSNLVLALENLNDDSAGSKTVWNQFHADAHAPGLFAIFDGHCGNQAARFAAERLTKFIYDESSAVCGDDDTSDVEIVERILARAINKLDHEFCNICVQGTRQWESGSTALIVVLVKEHLVIANVGDARAIMGRSVADPEEAALHEGAGWNELPLDDYNNGDGRRCLWKEVTEIHSPNREDERARIERANGWVTTECEIPVGQLKRMAFYDDDVVDILKRCFADRYQPSPKASAPHRVLQISRVCGELAVSRSLGDRDFKAAHGGRGARHQSAANHPPEDDDEEWSSTNLFLSWPEGHSQSFVGDLISNRPDFRSLRIGEAGSSEEFLLLACDGLWDVIDADDAYRVTRDLLFEKNWSAKKAAGRLAELAVHLGSSDNITVIVVRIFERT